MPSHVLGLTVQGSSRQAVVLLGSGGRVKDTVWALTQSCSGEVAACNRQVGAHEAQAPPKEVGALADLAAHILGAAFQPHKRPSRAPEHCVLPAPCSV